MISRVRPLFFGSESARRPATEAGVGDPGILGSSLLGIQASRATFMDRQDFCGIYVGIQSVLNMENPWFPCDSKRCSSRAFPKGIPFHIDIYGKLHLMCFFQRGFSFRKAKQTGNPGPPFPSPPIASPAAPSFVLHIGCAAPKRDRKRDPKHQILFLRRTLSLLWSVRVNKNSRRTPYGNDIMWGSHCRIASICLGFAPGEA